MLNSRAENERKVKTVFSKDGLWLLMNILRPCLAAPLRDHNRPFHTRCFNLYTTNFGWPFHSSHGVGFLDCLDHSLCKAAKNSSYSSPRAWASLTFAGSLPRCSRDPSLIYPIPIPITVPQSLQKTHLSESPAGSFSYSKNTIIFVKKQNIYPILQWPK